MEFSIVIPCLNEEKTLGPVVKTAVAALKRLGLDGEVVVADNGSTDASVAIAEREGARVVPVSSRGYGNALIGGIEGAKGKFIITGDADGAHNFDEIDEFVKFIHEGYDLVIGSRLTGSIEKGAMPFLHRYVGTPVLTFIINLLFKTKLTDCNSGMRCFSKEAFEKMQLSSPGMEFASEMLIKAGIMRLKIKEFPMNVYKDKRDRAPHLHTWRDGWRHLRFMLLYSPNYLFLLPGSILFILGLLIMLPLLNGQIQWNGHIFDFHFAILGSLLTILGFQILNTGLYAKAYTYNKNYEFYNKFIEKFYRIFTLEKGLLLGFVITLVGLGVDMSILLKSAANNFSGIFMPSLAVFGSSLIIIGIQTLFSAFLLDIMAITKKK